MHAQMWEAYEKLHKKLLSVMHCTKLCYMHHHDACAVSTLALNLQKHQQQLLVQTAGHELHAVEPGTLRA